jgi:hypothetical protein
MQKKSKQKHFLMHFYIIFWQAPNFLTLEDYFFGLLDRVFTH